MRSSPGKENKGGRCVVVLAPLGHSLTISQEVEDISDKEDRSLKGLKKGSFQPTRRIPQTKREKDQPHLLAKNVHLPPLTSIHYLAKPRVVCRTVFFPHPYLGGCGRHLFFLSAQSMFPVSSVNNTPIS